MFQGATSALAVRLPTNSQVVWPKLVDHYSYTQAVEHIGYILGGYDLYTFNMVQATSPDTPDVAVIQDFVRWLENNRCGW